MGRDCLCLPVTAPPAHFNPLSPHGERRKDGSRMKYAEKFQSTLPAWGETGRRWLNICRRVHFNPLSPHGERRRAGTIRRRSTRFQSTLPAWGETRHVIVIKLGMQFQSTLPAWGETVRQNFLGERGQFQSTLPAWGETRGHPPNHGGGEISIHSPRMGRDYDLPGLSI